MSKVGKAGQKLQSPVFFPRRVEVENIGPMAQYRRVSGSVGLITLQHPPVNALRSVDKSRYVS